MRTPGCRFKYPKAIHDKDERRSISPRAGRRDRLYLYRIHLQGPQASGRQALPVRIVQRHPAWLDCAVIAYELSRDAEVLAGGNLGKSPHHPNQLINIPARLASARHLHPAPAGELPTRTAVRHRPGPALSRRRSMSHRCCRVLADRVHALPGAAGQPARRAGGGPISGCGYRQRLYPDSQGNRPRQSGQINCVATVSG